MKTCKNFKINLVYENSGVSFNRFDQLIWGDSFIHPDNLDESTFINAYGGIELICDKHFIFFQSYDYYDLFPCVQFLFNSLYSLGVISSTTYDDYDESLKKGILSKLINSSGAVLYLEESDEMKVTISYINDSKIEINGRNNFYFDGIEIDKQGWINASVQSLNEYFIVVDSVLNQFPNKDANSYLRTLNTRWKVFYNDFKKSNG